MVCRANSDCCIRGPETRLETVNKSFDPSQTQTSYASGKQELRLGASAD